MRDKSREDYRNLKDLLKGDIKPIKGIDYPGIALFDRKVLINTGHSLDIDVEQITNYLKEDTDSKVHYSKNFVGVNHWTNTVDSKADLGIMYILKNSILEDYINGQFDN